MQIPYFIDFHCHPALKPYGKSFRSDSPGSNSLNSSEQNSLWFYDPPKFIDRLIQLICGISKFRQSDCRTLNNGNCRLVFASIYPIERGFFRSKLGTRIISDLGNNFVTSVGQSRVNYIQNVTDYFEDLNREYKYYLQLHGKEIQAEGKTYQYRMIRFFDEIDQLQENSTQPENLVFLALSIEGLHALNKNIDAPPVEKEFLDNLNQVKRWEYTPLFVTVAHHFYNHLCGHAKSLFDIVGSVTDQSEGINSGFTELGRKVICELLSNVNGKRIYVDIKHMSSKGRKEYMEMLRSPEYRDEKIPIIVSHGAANGMRSMDEPVIDIAETGDKFLKKDINFYDNEIIEVAKSGGIFGLQLDERRLAKKGYKVKHSAFLHKIQHYRAELVWNHIQHIAELLDKNKLPAWDIITLGTDHDGIINPLNGYLTSENLKDLLQYLERYAYNYMADRGIQILSPANRLAASDIVQKVFSENGMRFLKQLYV